MHKRNDRELPLRALRTIAIMATTTLAVGCESADNVVPTPSSAGGDPAGVDGKSSHTSFLTIATYGADRQLSVRQQPLTTQQREEMIRQRIAQTIGPGDSTGGSVEKTSRALTVEPTCPGTSLWMFSGANLTGDVLCLSKDPGNYLEAVALTAFSYDGLFQTWSGRVASFWAGSDPGYLGIIKSGVHDGLRFGSYQRVDAFANGAYAVMVDLDNNYQKWLEFSLYRAIGVPQTLISTPSDTNLDTTRASIGGGGYIDIFSQPTLLGMTYTIDYRVAFENPLHTICTVYTDMWGTYVNGSRLCAAGSQIYIDRYGCRC